jgi:uncharacterized protein YjbI with pentapeptide repeats
MQRVKLLSTFSKEHKMSKITIFNINGSEIFSHECEGNTIKTTVEEAVKQGVNLTHAILNGAVLNGAVLNGAILNGAILMGAILYSANLYGATLTGANLYGANLTGANLTGTDLTGTDLTGANLYGANLYGANLTDTDLTDTDLTDAKLSRANLIGAYLTRANLDGEILSSKTPISLTNLKWPVLITDGYMRIGCQRHTHSEWGNFSDEEISKMAEGAGEFWKQWKIGLIEMCKVHAKS